MDFSVRSQQDEQGITARLFSLPTGLLLDCFQCLHQEGAISLAAFKVWSNSDQSDGRGVALKQLNTFYQMLNEQDPEVEV